MKCHACGYIGFDHLSECSKCGSDLSTSRDGFGFVAAKPTVPFFLGLLLKDYQQGTPVQTKETAGAHTAFPSIPELEFGDDLDLSEDPLEMGTAMKPPAEPLMEIGSFPAAANLIDDTVMIDLSDEELDRFSNGNGSQEDMDLNLEILLEGDLPAVGVVPSSSGAAPKSTLQMSEYDSTTHDLTDEDLAQLTGDIDSIEALRSTPSNGSQKNGEKNEDMSLELSDDDLHTLTAEM